MKFRSSNDDDVVDVVVGVPKPDLPPLPPQLTHAAEVRPADGAGFRLRLVGRRS